MKKVGIFCFFLVPGTSTMVFAQSSKFVIKGDVTNVKEPIEWAYLTYNIYGQRITDSVQMKENKYSFSGSITEATQAGLRIKYNEHAEHPGNTPFNSKRDFAIIFLQPGIMTVSSNDSFSNITVAGSRADEEYRKLEAQAKPFNEILDELYIKFAAARKNRDTISLQRLEKEIDSTDALANEKIYGAYVRQNPGSPLALYALRNWAGYDIDPQKIEPAFRSLPASTRKLPGGKDMEEKISLAKRTALGQMATDFNQNDTLGNPVLLSSFRGKYLLVDFWASWCGPCRAENPSLVKAFARFKEKGFNILGVSLDRPGARDKWLKAIHEDGLTWSHVSDLRYWDNEVAVQYGIQAIPQNLLLDPAGKIIGKNLRGEALDKKLASIFQK
jgi:peroxiredoxin